MSAEAIIQTVDRRLQDNRVQELGVVIVLCVLLAMVGCNGAGPMGVVLSPADPFDGKESGQEREDNALKMKLAWCPPGSFRMGSPLAEPGRHPDEDPVNVRLTRGFWMAKYEATQSQWRQVMGNNPSHFSPQGDGKFVVKGMDTSQFPVESVTWEDAMKFCRKLTESEKAAGRLPANWEYTLPTEAQWEYACRAGTATATAFGDTLDSTQANIVGHHPYPLLSPRKVMSAEVEVAKRGTGSAKRFDRCVLPPILRSLAG